MNDTKYVEVRTAMGTAEINRYLKMDWEILCADFCQFNQSGTQMGQVVSYIPHALVGLPVGAEEARAKRLASEPAPQFTPVATQPPTPEPEPEPAPPTPEPEPAPSPVAPAQPQSDPVAPVASRPSPVNRQAQFFAAADANRSEESFIGVRR